MNWMLGGLSSGFAIVLYTFYLYDSLEADVLARMNLLAAALMGGGLLSVF
jgi:hypothetical protein